MAENDVDAPDVVPSDGGDGRRNRRLIWAAFGVLLVGVGVGLALVLAPGGDDDSPEVAVDEKALVTSSTRASTTTPSATTATRGSSATSAPAASGGGSGTNGSGGGGGTGGGSPTPTSPPATAAPTTVPRPTSSTFGVPKITSASVTPDYVVCPKFGGDTTVTVTYQSENASRVLLTVVISDPPSNGWHAEGGAYDSVAVVIPCNGTQQTVSLFPDAIHGPGPAGEALFLVVNEGIEGT